LTLIHTFSNLCSWEIKPVQFKITGQLGLNPQTRQMKTFIIRSLKQTLHGHEDRYDAIIQLLCVFIASVPVGHCTMHKYDYVL